MAAHEPRGHDRESWGSRKRGDLGAEGAHVARS